MNSALADSMMDIQFHLVSPVSNTANVQRLRALHKDLQASFECIDYDRILNKAHANNYLAMESR